jgi:hypothetical protein
LYDDYLRLLRNYSLGSNATVDNNDTATISLIALAEKLNGVD